MRATVFFLFLLSVLSGCDLRKPPEESEVFIQETIRRQRQLYSSFDQEVQDTLWLDLLTAEQQYRFTDTQRLRLRLFFIKDFILLNATDELEFMTGLERLAVQAGVDSLLVETRLELFKKYIDARDTAGAQELLRRLEPSLRQKSPEESRPLYHSMSQMYRRLRQRDQYDRWVARMQPYLEPRKASWYQQISEGYMEFGDYRRAISYADTAIRLLPPRSVVQVPHLVIGVSLARLGKTSEATRWFDQSIRQIREFQQKKGIRTMSGIQTQLFYEYALLLKQAGRTHEAISLIDTLPIAKTYDPKGELALLPIQMARLLSEYSHDRGDTRMAAHYSWIADSIRINVSDQLRGDQRSDLWTHLRSRQLITKLAWKEKEAAQARFRQQLSTAAIGLLTAIILAGYLWWRSRRRRLRQLFDLLMVHHASWLQIHDPYPLPPSPRRLPPEKAAYNEEAPPHAPDNLRRLYDQALRVMKEQQPFLDPGLDLVALARLVGTNRTDLSTALNRQTGMNFSRWLAEYRVNHLLRLAGTSPGTELTELATKSGFTSRTSFFRQFRQVTGLTPSQYKAGREQAGE